MIPLQDLLVDLSFDDEHDQIVVEAKRYAICTRIFRTRGAV